MTGTGNRRGRGGGQPMSDAIRHAVARLPRVPGVYRFRDEAHVTLYLGRATDLRSRVASYWSGLRTRSHLVSMVASAASVEAIACASLHEAAWLERNLLEADKPCWNRALGGQESQVFVRLDRDSSRPRLGVVYRPQPAPGVRFYGPYLGGTRVRLAVQGLRRVAPLELSGMRLRGTAAEIAGLRGVSPADREELVERAAAVLDREPAAVAWALAGLGEMRDRASSALAFELAAAIHDEIRGMEWVTSLQRVTSADGGDYEVRAWHDGVAVEFGVRSGRLREWRQEARPRPGPGLGPGAGANPSGPSGPSGPADPADLAELARQAAELAAAMRQ